MHCLEHRLENPGSHRRQRGRHALQLMCMPASIHNNDSACQILPTEELALPAGWQRSCCQGACRAGVIHRAITARHLWKDLAFLSCPFPHNRHALACVRPALSGLLLAGASVMGLPVYLAVCLASCPLSLLSRVQFITQGSRCSGRGLRILCEGCNGNLMPVSATEAA